MSSNTTLVDVIRAIGRGEVDVAQRLLGAVPALATACLGRADEQFLEECRAQLYAGDTALHAAAFAYDTDMARHLVEAGADVRARNRRGGEPLHSSTMGSLRGHWDPAAQRTVIAYLVRAGAEPDARATGGVTPLHRAVRNRCSAAVEALLLAGADAGLANDSGSTASDLARWTTGRGGTGSTEARAEQQRIIDLLAMAGAGAVLPAP